MRDVGADVGMQICPWIYLYFQLGLAGGRALGCFGGGIGLNGLSRLALGSAVGRRP